MQKSKHVNALGPHHKAAASY